MEEKELKRELKNLGIKSLFNSKKKKMALGIIAVVATAGIISTFLIMEYVRSQNRIILATTTSTYDSGLLDYLIPTWEAQSGITVEVLSVGTGTALKYGETGDADVLLVHSRSREDDFISAGFGLYRTCVMYNDFIIIGPSVDPAGLMSADNITDAITKLKAAGVGANTNFTSRGDNSGTHSKELSLWASIGFVPDAATDAWYYETGEGMATTLTVANQRDGYTLIDRGTWLSQKANVDLLLSYEANKTLPVDEALLNPYGAMLVNPLIHTGIKYDLALDFVAFLVSEQGQKLIGDYRKNNEILFYPCFGKCNETHSCDTTENEVEFWRQHNGGHIRTTSIGISSILSNYPQYGTIF